MEYVLIALAVAGWLFGFGIVAAGLLELRGVVRETLFEQSAFWLAFAVGLIAWPLWGFIGAWDRYYPSIYQMGWRKLTGQPRNERYW